MDNTEFFEKTLIEHLKLVGHTDKEITANAVLISNAIFFALAYLQDPKLKPSDLKPN